jgi:peptidase E
MKRQIIAMGGGGFSDEPENPLLDDYILNQASKTNPKICFIGTASGDAEAYIQNFYKCFEKRDCSPSHLSLFAGHTDKIEEFILDQDILFVGGGNTRNMLVLWKEWGLDLMVKKAYQRGTILSGVSAGAICWFEEGLTDSIPNQITKLNCLGFLRGSNCPHFDGEPERQAVYREKISSGEMKSGIACDDGVALHFVNENLFRIVSSQENKRALRYEMKTTLIEDLLEPEYLKKGNPQKLK